MVETVARAVTELEECYHDLLGEIRQVLDTFPPDVVSKLGPDRVGETLAGRLLRAVGHLLKKSQQELDQAFEVKKEAHNRIRGWEALELRMREEVSWLSSQLESARLERDRAERVCDQEAAKADASLKMVKEFRARSVALEKELEEARGETSDLRSTHGAGGPVFGEDNGSRDAMVETAEKSVEQIDDDSRGQEELAGRFRGLDADPAETPEPKTALTGSPLLDEPEELPHAAQSPAEVSSQRVPEQGAAGDPQQASIDDPPQKKNVARESRRPRWKKRRKKNKERG